MRKIYPYLFNVYTDNENVSAEKRNFLKSIDNYVNQKQYVKIILLNWAEEPLKEIQGEITGGSITKDGSSTVRRSGSISTTLDYGKYDIDNIGMDYSINKKVFIELGIENNSNQYLDYPILWFPQGVFYISGISLNAAANGTIGLTITLKDKMLSLNGEIGGMFEVATDIDTDADNEKIRLYDLIISLVHEWGGEELNNIIVDDVDLKAQKLLQWNGTESVDMYRDLDETTGIYSYRLAPHKETPGEGFVKVCSAGTLLGYELTDLISSSTITINAGESVITALDKIKSLLGNYEYYYDEYGIFHFQEIRNYTNTTQSTSIIRDMSEKTYLVEHYPSKSTYSFNNDNNIVQLSITPNYSNIKNDYVINGIKKGTSDSTKTAIMYHVAIDNKPDIGNSYSNMIIYHYNNSTTETSVNAGYDVAAFPIEFNDILNFPLVGVDDFVYKINKGSASALYASGDDDRSKWIRLLDANGVKLGGGTTIDEDLYYRWYGNCYIAITPLDDCAFYGNNVYTTQDWREEIYLQTLMNKTYGTEQNINVNLVDRYGTELVAFFPQIYNLKEHCFIGYENELSSVQSLYNNIYFLDFLDPRESTYGEFSVSNIGRRTDVVNEETINCLFEPDIPQINYIYTGDKTEEEIAAAKKESINNGVMWAQVSDEYYKYFGLGQEYNSAFERIRYEIYLHTNYQKSVSITALPVFYLEPNVLTRIDDSCTNTHGDYLIKSINLTLGAGKTMTVSATESFSRTTI